MTIDSAMMVFLVSATFSVLTCAACAVGVSLSFRAKPRYPRMVSEPAFPPMTEEEVAEMQELNEKYDQLEADDFEDLDDLDIEEPVKPK